MDSPLTRRNTAANDNKHKLALYPTNPDFLKVLHDRDRSVVLDTKNGNRVTQTPT